MDNPTFILEEEETGPQPPVSTSHGTVMDDTASGTCRPPYRTSPDSACDSPVSVDSAIASDSASSAATTATMTAPPYRKIGVQHVTGFQHPISPTWDSASQGHSAAFSFPTAQFDAVSVTRQKKISTATTLVESPAPTDQLDKQEWFKHAASENLSIMYAIFVVMLGIVMYTADMFRGRESMVAECFNVLLISVQVLWLLYIHFDARSYVNSISKMLDEAEARNKSGSTKGSNPSPQAAIPLHYGFTSGRHGGSIYIKIGATVFCFGHMIHTGLNLSQKVLYLTGEDSDFVDCTNVMDVTMSVLQPICGFYQLFFIFKYSNLIINRRYALSRFGLMHCIGSSLCYWIYTILQETLHTLHNSESSNSTSSYSTKDSSSWSLQYGCDKDTYLSDMINYTTPYLFPFSIEFYILMVGLWMSLRENIGKVERHTHIPSVEVVYEGDPGPSLTSNLVIFVDCHSSNRGLFAGLFMTVVTVISIILLFILSSNDTDTGDIGKYVNGTSEVVLLSVMVVAAAAAYKLIFKLDVVKLTDINVDDILLYVSLPCIFFYAFLRLAPSIMYSDALFGAMAILQILQVIIQTALIYDGMRRCSNSSALRHKKPGREVITFLVVVNVALWLLQTFEVKTVGSNYEMYKFYGKELWTFLSHLTLPFALFYRFHSSGCLASMWMCIYEMDEVH